MGRRIKKKTTRRKNTPVKRRNQYVKRRKGSVKRINKTSKRNKFSKRTNMKYGGFKIYEDEVIGKGGQGTAIKKVFEIEENDVIQILETDVGKKVCFVKKIFPDFEQKVADDDPDLSTGRGASAPLISEVSLMGELDHVNIIKMHSWGFDKDSSGDIIHPYIIMDYFNCIDLKHMIREKVLVATEPDGGCSKNTLTEPIGHGFAQLFGTDPGETRRDFEGFGGGALGSLYGGGTRSYSVDDGTKLFIIKEIFNGIQYLHEKKIIHRDIKLTNIFLNIDQDHHLLVVIGDLGLASVVNDIYSDPLIDRDGGEKLGIMGSPAYIPTEIKSTSLLTQDYYAFGVVILQVILMRDIFEGGRYTNRLIFDITNNPSELEACGACGPLLKRLLYIPDTDAVYAEILRKRQEAYEEIGKIARGPLWIKKTRPDGTIYYYNQYTTEWTNEKPPLFIE
jgi:serine/threonine protein kinase